MQSFIYVYFQQNAEMKFNFGQSEFKYKPGVSMILSCADLVLIQIIGHITYWRNQHFGQFYELWYT